MLEELTAKHQMSADRSCQRRDCRWKGKDDIRVQVRDIVDISLYKSLHQQGVDLHNEGSNSNQ